MQWHKGAPMKIEEAKGPVVIVDRGSVANEGVSIKGPLSFWLFFLVIAAIARISQLNSYPLIQELPAYIFYMPGCFALPLIVAIWMGERIGEVKSTIKGAMASAFINAAYIFLIYAITAFIIFAILNTMALLPESFSKLIFYDAIIPFAIIFALMPLLALLSILRRK